MKSERMPKAVMMVALRKKVRLPRCAVTGATHTKSANVPAEWNTERARASARAPLGFRSPPRARREPAKTRRNRPQRRARAGRPALAELRARRGTPVLVAAVWWGGGGSEGEEAEGRAKGVSAAGEPRGHERARSLAQKAVM